MTGHAALARANFETGCNCAQAVLCAYPELLPRETAMKLGASLGGGIGRLREVCGAVSAIVLLAGLLRTSRRTSASRRITPACRSWPTAFSPPMAPISAGTFWPG